MHVYINSIRLLTIQSNFQFQLNYRVSLVESTGTFGFGTPIDTRLIVLVSGADR